VTAHRLVALLIGRHFREVFWRPGKPDYADRRSLRRPVPPPRPHHITALYRRDRGPGEAKRVWRRGGLLDQPSVLAYPGMKRLVLRGLAVTPRPREQLDHLAVKCGNIIGLAAGDQIAVDDGFLIDDIGSSIL